MHKGKKVAQRFKLSGATGLPLDFHSIIGRAPLLNSKNKSAQCLLKTVCSIVTDDPLRVQ